MQRTAFLLGGIKMEEARKSRLTINYKDKDITRGLLDYISKFSYEDSADGESDTLTISLSDKSRKWIGGWMPEKGDRISATIKTYNWNKDGDYRRLFCGDFTLDNLSGSGEPLTLDIGAISGPTAKGFRETSRGKTWKKTNIKKIGTIIASRYGMKLYYDAPVIPIKLAEQSDSDSAFLAALCGTYGMVMKAYKKKIVIYDRERYKAKTAAMTIDRKTYPIDNWGFDDTLTRLYTGGQLTYTNSKTNKEVKKTVGKKTMLLKLDESADSAADAERKIKAAVNRENHGKTKISISCMGDTRVVAGICITIKNFGSKLSGKYYVDKVTHEIDPESGYTMQLDLSKVVKGL